MASLMCPHCGTAMEHVVEEDITTDKCPSCGGVFLEHGELNVLATGMAGDIEFCSVDHDVHAAPGPARKCPRCHGRPMEKVSLLQLSDLLFDYCESCQGLFLDKDEIEAINTQLVDLTSNRAAEEFRGRRDGHLIRINRVSEVEPVLVEPFTGSNLAKPGLYIRAAVYFTKPLRLGLHISQEAWKDRLVTLFGLLDHDDVATGNGAFDHTFLVHGRDVDGIRAVLADDVQQALLGFVKRGQPIFSTFGTLEISDRCISYQEGPYKPDSIDPYLEKLHKQLAEQSEPTIEALLDIAKRIESAKA